MFKYKLFVLFWLFAASLTMQGDRASASEES